MTRNLITLSIITVAILLMYSKSYSIQSEDTSMHTSKKYTSILDKFLISAYSEVYYAYDFNTNNIKYGNQRILSATCPFNNEFRLNLIRFFLKYNDENFRGTIALQYGDIPFLLKSPEKEYLGMLNQGFFGIRVLNKIWIDFGYMNNPIGLESTQTNKNLLTSVSVGGYCQPDNILGVKVTWNASDIFYASVQIYNTYGIISTPFLNKYLGLSLGFNPTDNITIGYNNAFTNFGMEGESNYFQMYNNMYFTWNLFGKIDLKAQFDFAFQTNSKLSDTNATAYVTSGFLGLRYRFLPELSISTRGEFFFDPDGIISQGIAGSNDHLKTWGVAIGIQYSPFKKFNIRGEYLLLKSDQEIFYYCKNFRNSILFSTSLEL